jgi:hypothetical protein
VVDKFFLSPYMRRFLIRRNEALRALAESENWKKYIPA